MDHFGENEKPEGGQNLFDALPKMIVELAVMGLLFAGLARHAGAAGGQKEAHRARAETRLNLVYYFLDGILLVPVLGLMAGALQALATDHVPRLFTPEDYQLLGAFLTGVLALFVLDFAGYWRHRLMHWTPLWPVHAIHHSDRHLNWLALARFHPLNRAIAVAVSLMAGYVMGFPAWAIAVAAGIRHYYGYAVHANLPWRLGPLKYIFVSPVFHRWHHVRDEGLAGHNFATVFSCLDLAFGTFRLPAGGVEKLGIEEKMPGTWTGQFLYPFRVWTRAFPGILRKVRATQFTDVSP